MEFAIIGGTGVYSAGESRKELVKTEYGDVQVDIVKTDGIEVVFLPRHGGSHSLPPHLINYRANIKALKNLGVKFIYATCAVGSMNKDYGVGDVVIINDFLDFTKNRKSTFFEGETGVKHVLMDEPYSSYMNEKFREEAKKSKLDIKGEAVYVTTEGPRFETAAEISFYAQVGGDVVGMTNFPEVVLAKELKMGYAAVGIVTNMCTGMTSSIELHDIEGSVEKNKGKIIDCFVAAFKNGLDYETLGLEKQVIEL